MHADRMERLGKGKVASIQSRPIHHHVAREPGALRPEQPFKFKREILSSWHGGTQLGSKWKVMIQPGQDVPSPFRIRQELAPARPLFRRDEGFHKFSFMIHEGGGS
jgi:hypothetical protein